MIAIPIRPRVGRVTEANTYSWAGGTVSILFSAEETDGAFGMIEAVQRPGAEPPLHVHEREDETIYVLEGRIDVFLEDTWHNLVPGESIFMPRAVPHTFRIRSSKARAVTVITPGGFESWFRILGKPAHIFGIPDKILPPTEDDFVRMLELGERMGVRLIPESVAF